MAAVITHSVSAGGVVDATASVDGAAWDANHVITGVMTPAQGGTGIVNNDASTITISGSFGATFTLTATTSVTFPTTGTLATLAGTEALTNKTYNGNTWTAGTGILTIAALKTLTASNTLTFTGTDGSSVAFGAGGTVVYTASYGTGVATALAVNVGSAGAFVVNGGALGTPSSGTLTSATGLPISTGLTGAGTGVLTALGVNVGSAGAPVVFNGALGTPSSGTLTNATGLPLAGLAAQSAYTVIGNFTGSSAVPTASTIPGLTHKATPVGADTMMLADSAASSALKYATLTEILGAVVSGVSSIAGNTGAFTLTYPLNNSTNAIVSQQPPQCGRLTYVSTTAVKFAPFNGDLIKISGTLYQIPSAGIAGVANTSVYVGGVAGQNLASSTLYYVYAFNNAGTITADFRTGAHSASATAGNIGTEILTGDDTRTLVGAIRTNGSSQFADGAAQRFVISWFNRRGIGAKSVFTANRALTTTAAWAEINTEIRNEFITWSEESVSAGFSGGMFINTAADQMYMGIAFDGATAEDSGTFVCQGSNTIIFAVGVSFTKNGLSEGYHYATVSSYSATGSGGGSATGTATSALRSGLSIGIRG